MISKRNFLSIVSMMAVLLLLFQFSMIFRDWKNTYDVNENYQPKQADEKSVWKQQRVNLKANEIQNRDYLVFVGNPGGNMERSAQRWCIYQKWNMASISSLNDISTKMKTIPRMILLESETYAKGKNLQKLKEMEKNGTIVIFGCLENPKNIKTDKELMKFLGISKVVTDQTKLEGVKLFEGFLLGGDAVYDAEKSDDPIEKKKQDLKLNVPWYQVGSGTKTYMAGVFDENKKLNGKKIKNEELPTIVWRNGSSEGNVFAVVGDYMKDSTAMGFLDGMLSEGSEYTIYPVVNAQNFSMVDVPFLANENNEKMQKLYSEPVVSMIRDIIWPALVSISEKSQFKMTCFIQPQSDYLDQIQPMKGNLKFYLKQMKEQDAEAGISMQYRKVDSLADKQKEDEGFFKDEGSSYKYGAAAVNYENLPLLLNLKNTGLMKNISTITCARTEETPILSYCTDSITLQTATNDAVNYKYSDDIRMRSIQSALGYTNSMFDFQQIFYPKKRDDEWQNVQKRLAANIMTYWANFKGFESTTLSKSSGRVRTFLNLDYRHYKKNNHIMLNTTHKKSWFLLRTNTKIEKKINGGKSKKIEDGVYLIYATSNKVDITLKQQRLHYYSKTN